VRGGTDGRNTESGTATVAGGILIMHERRPNRAPRFDYSSRGAYFITTNVKHRAEWFGRLRDGRMVLNADGLIAHRCWMEIPEHFPGVRIDAFVVMPDHVHGILVIDDVPSVGNAPVGDAYMRPLQGNDRTKMTMPKIVQQYKAAVTREINRVYGHAIFQWQRSYHDTIIRDHQALHGIRRYIGENPVRRGG